MDLLTTVLRSMTSKECWNAFRDIINAELFTNALARGVFNHLERIHDDTPDDITLEDLRLDILAVHTEESDARDNLLELVARFDDIPLRSPAQLRRYVHQFADRELGLQASEYILAHANSMDYDAAVPAELLNRAVEVRSTVDSTVEHLSDIQLMTQEEMRPGLIPMRCSKKMTADINGGMANGELTLYVGGPGVGKTNFLWDTCIGAAEQGKHVLGVTLEVNTRKCRQRCYSALTHLKSPDLITNPQMVQRAMDELPGTVMMKNMTANKPTVDDLHALISRMRQRGEQVDVLMVDYMKLMRPTGLSRNDNKYHAYESIAVGLRELGEDLQIPTLSAWQPTRDVCTVRVLMPDNVGECWAVMQHADMVFGLNQNIEEKGNNILRLGCMKQRESSVWPLHYLHYNPERMVIKDADEETEDQQTRTLGNGT